MDPGRLDVCTAHPLSAKPANARRLNFALPGDARGRGVLYQVLVVGGVILLGWFLVSNALDNLARQNIATGFGFLDREAAFGIGESLIAYSPADHYSRALLVGFLNTLQVAALGILLATSIGIVVGLARLSDNWLIAKLASVFVEATRNVPVLLQLFFWYALITQAFPSPRRALEPVAGIFLSNRGIKFPVPVWEPAQLLIPAALVLGAALWVLGARRVRQKGGSFFWPGLGAVIILPIIAFILSPLQMEVPVLKGFNFRGGGSVSPEFAALLIGLSVYTASFIAEIVRGGVLAVPQDQKEAARALGLTQGQSLRLIILPQALRVIVPPVTNQYLNLTKNSSLAVAIGYPDLVSVANTSINQTGQAVEGIAIIMIVYLSISLAISVFMNAFNRRIARTELGA